MTPDNRNTPRTTRYEAEKTHGIARVVGSVAIVGVVIGGGAVGIHEAKQAFEKNAPEQLQPYMHDQDGQQ
jgi:hypothetical protein